MAVSCSASFGHSVYTWHHYEDLKHPYEMQMDLQKSRKFINDRSNGGLAHMHYAMVKRNENYEIFHLTLHGKGEGSTWQYSKIVCSEEAANKLLKIIRSKGSTPFDGNDIDGFV